VAVGVYGYRLIGKTAEGEQTTRPA
jgi:hypothetical protein